MTTFLDNRIPPPIVMVIVGAAMAAGPLIAAPVPLPFNAPIRYGVAGALLLLAVFYGPRAIRAFARAGTTINPVNLNAASQLVTGGPFALSRNPMYVSMALLLTALAVLLNNGWAFIGPVLFVIFITVFQIIPEERVMLAKFGDAYSAYRKRVRRWI